MDNAARARQRVLALFLPLAAVLYVSAEALDPKGTDKVISTIPEALKVLPIAAAHPAQLYLAGSLSLLALGALAVSYAGIATLVRGSGSALATVAALLGALGAFCGALVNVLVGVNLAAAATAHMTQHAAARFLVTSFNSGFEHVFSGVYFAGIVVAPILMGVALWRSRSVPRWLAVLFAARAGGRPAGILRRPCPRRTAHAAVRGRDAAARGQDVAGGYEVGQPRQCGGGSNDAGSPGQGRRGLWPVIRRRLGRPASSSARERPACGRVNCEEDGGVSFWQPAESPLTRPPRSWAFDIGCAVVAGAASLAHFSFGQAARPAHLSVATGAIVVVATAGALPLRRVWPGPVFVWTVLAAVIVAQWPDRGALFPVALAISLYTVAAMMRRVEALAAASLVVGAILLVAAADGTPHWAVAVPNAAGFAAAVLILGLYVGTRRAYLAALRDRARQLERERDQSSALAAIEERSPHRPRDAR